MVDVLAENCIESHDPPELLRTCSNADSITDLFSQVSETTKFLNLMIFKYFDFVEYFDDVK